MKSIKAYYCGWHFPADTRKEPPYANVQIQYDDNSWDEIWRMTLRRGIDRKSENACTRVVLEHYLGTPVSDEQVDCLVDMPGSSLCRLESFTLQKFRQGLLFGA